jgi:tol-pal system protein YbgF
MNVIVIHEFARHTKQVTASLCVAATLCSAFTCAAVIAAPAPVYDAVAQSATVSDLEKRVTRLENRLNNQNLADMIQRVDQLQRDMQQLIGDIEVQSHELKSLREQQRKIYSDIDQRLRQLEGGNRSSSAPAQTQPSTTTGGMPTSPVPVAPRSGGGAPGSQQPAATSAMSEVERNVARSAYERGFNLLKQGRYELAAKSLTAFLETYPKAAYADNAQYWLAEANYAQENYKVALQEFRKVIDNYPNSPKRADAMLKIGYTYDELGDKKLAMQTLNTIVSTYPKSTAARLAQKRIKNLKSSR